MIEKQLILRKSYLLLSVHMRNLRLKRWRLKCRIQILSLDLRRRCSNVLLTSTNLQLKLRRIKNIMDIQVVKSSILER